MSVYRPQIPKLWSVHVGMGTRDFRFVAFFVLFFFGFESFYYFPFRRTRLVVVALYQVVVVCFVLTPPTPH